jgi:hypothetical protein
MLVLMMAEHHTFRMSFGPLTHNVVICLGDSFWIRSTGGFFRVVQEVLGIQVRLHDRLARD